MKKRLQGLIAGVLIGATVTGGAVIAANATTLYDVIADGIKIVIDGKELHPTDAQGNKVEPMIYNGTTYLPVRAVANALGKAVYWDGPNYTVYLGEIPNGPLPYPTIQIEDVDNIGKDITSVDAESLTDNYGNTYGSAIRAYQYGGTFQTLLNMKYSKFKGTIYVPKGCSRDDVIKILIKADGKTIYNSPEITKTSSPIPLELNIKGCNDFQIEIIGNHTNLLGYIADGGFYQ